jgi:uncharacterized protein (UPF0179 family)
MLKRLFTTILAVVAIAGFAQTASAQYMFMDVNGDGLYNPAVDKMNANGVATVADVYVVTNQNRDGSTAICDSDDDNGNPPGFTPLTINSYAFNLEAVNGTVTYSGYINRDPVNMPTPFGEINLDGIHYKNGFGGLLTQNPGKYRLATLTITGQTGSPSITFVDQINGSNDFTAFGTRCDGNGFDSTYKLDGPVTQSIQGAGDWFDADGLPAGGPPANNPPVLAAIGNKTIAEGSLLSFTATATDPDAGQTLTFSLGAGNPAGSAITAGGAFTWTPTEAQGPGTYPITVNVADNASPTPGTDSETIQVTVTEVNVAPVVTNPGNRTVAEGSLLSFTVTATDADIPAQTITFSLGAGAPASAAITAGGAFTWTPTEAQGPGVYPITFNASDGSLTGSASINVTVTEVNVAPILAAIGNKTVQVNTPLTFTATATDADLPANTLTFSLGAGAPAGATIGASTGNFSWTPTTTVGSPFSVTIIVTDNGTPALNDTETISITVNNAPNTAPVLAAIGNRTVNELALLSFTATATDAEGGALTFTLEAGAPAGAAITTAGAFTWTPTEAQGPGVYPITVRVTDSGGLFDNEAINVTVNEVNVPPVVTNPGNRTVAEGSLLSFTVTATDTDLPAQTLTFSLGAGAPAGAAITAGGAFTWTPTEAQGPGSYPITFNVSDGVATGSASITVTVTEVNTPPVLAAIGNKTVAEGSLLSFTATATDSDVPANTLTFSLGAGAPAGAAITAGGAFTWTPTEAQGPGTYPITVNVSDGTATASELIQVTVTEVNVAPILAAIGNKTVAEGSLLSFTATATDADVPAQTLTFTLGAGAPAGAAITAGGAFTWTPTEAQGPGSYPITVIVTDNGTPALNDTEAITVTVTEVNVAPILAVIGNRTVAEGSLLSFTATATDADVPANTLTFTLGAGAPAGAAITTAGAFTWTPSETQGGSTFPITVIVTDNGTPALNDTETIQVTVTEVNVAPVLGTIGNKSGTVGNAITFTATATDADVPAQTLTFSLGAGAPAGATIGASTGNFSWTPSATGTFSVTVIVTDNGTPALNDTETITITVSSTPNTAPVLAPIGNKTVAEGSLLSFTATATDSDVPAQTLTFSLGAGAPAGAVITAGGAFTWTPTEAQGPGVYPITVIVTDNGTGNLSDNELIQVTVTEVNVAPILAAIGNKTVAEGSLLSFTATATDADLPANTLTFSLGAGAPAGAAITAGGAFTWTPTEAQGPGSYPITVIVTDNGTPALNDTEAITVTVTEVNAPPVLAAIGNKTVAEGSLLSFTATATDSDVPANTLTFSLGAGAPAGAAITAGGAFTWTPTEAQGPGTYPITVNVSDGTATVSELIQVTVTEVNVAPILAAIGNKTVNEGVLLSFTATATDADVPANTLTFTLGAGAPAGAAITAGGAFTWTPTEAQGPGSYPITVIVTDNGAPALNDTETITVTVNEANNPPTVTNPGNQTVNEGVLLAFTVTATDSDVPAQTITFSLAAGAPAGAAITAGGNFTWTPTEAQGPGVYTITVNATDNGTPAQVGSATFNVTVNEVNQAPILALIGNKTVAEGSLLSFTATATDADLPAQTLTFSLSAGNPAGSAITAGGSFTWTPTEAQGPGSYSITVNVSDGAGGTDSETITVTVTEVNVAPVLAPIGNKSGSTGNAITFTATATDADIPANTLTFSLGAGAPAGATIGASSGAFSWTPSASGTFTVTVIVTDNGTPALNDTETITITVSQTNTAPVLAAIGNKTVAEGSLLSFTATATDTPGDVLTFTLEAGAPAGAAITAGGNFTWTRRKRRVPATI